MNDLQTAFTEKMSEHEFSSLHQKVSIAAHYAKKIFDRRKFYAVTPESEQNSIQDAYRENDLPMLLAFIKYGPSFHAGCIRHTLQALREMGIEEELSEHHLSAAQMMITAVVEALRRNVDINFHLDKKLEQQYIEITGYAVVNHGKAEFISSLVTDRNMQSLEQVLEVLDGMNGTTPKPLERGFL